MKVVALLLCGLAVAAANEHWENFKIKYGKSYANVEDESYRKSVYERNQNTIDAHNERFRQGLVTFDMAMNQFGDMTQEEIASTMNGLRNVKWSHNGPQEVPVHQVHQSSSKPLVNDIDWREKGAVTPVVDQGLLCESWAISATGALEGQHFLQSGELVKLSEQNLIDCVLIPDYGVNGCSGGIVDAAFEYVRDNGGIDTAESYSCGSCTGTCCFDPATIGATCTGYVDILAGSEPDLQDAVQNVCPVSVAIDASHMSFQFYSSGIYYEPSCSSQNIDHAVLTVGFGEQSGNDYWIVKNSWGTSWGEEGYIRMARNKDNNCGIASSASYPTV